MRRADSHWPFWGAYMEARFSNRWFGNAGAIDAWETYCMGGEL